MKKSKIHSQIFARDVRAIPAEAVDAADYKALQKIGIGFDSHYLQDAVKYYGSGMDDQQGLITTASIGTPVQFLQNWLPGNVNAITAARKIDDLVGIMTTGSWEDEEVVQGVLEPVGFPALYGDYTNVPLSSWNMNFEKRTVVRFEKGLKVGRLEEARAGRMRIDSAGEKRTQAGLSLEIQRNLIGFNGFNGGNNRTYGFLNDPGLPAYVTVPVGAAASTLWSKKTALEIITDIQSWAAALQNQSQDNINPEDTETTLALATVSYQWLNTVSSLVANSVRTWITQNYPKMRVVSAPQLNGANGGSNVAYLYADRVNDASTDGGATMIQVVPAKFMALGVEQQSKGFVEDYTNATAGIMVKRPWAVYRASGI